MLTSATEAVHDRLRINSPPLSDGLGLTPGDTGRAIKLEERAEVRRLHRAEVCRSRRSPQVGVARKTVRSALKADARPTRGPVVDAVEPQFRALLAQWPRMPATVIGERVFVQPCAGRARDDGRLRDRTGMSIGIGRSSEGLLAGDVIRGITGILVARRADRHRACQYHLIRGSRSAAGKPLLTTQCRTAGLSLKNARSSQNPLYCNGVGIAEMKVVYATSSPYLLLPLTRASAHLMKVIDQAGCVSGGLAER